jgi:imidazolonepropionase-like amidohydrolase
MTSSPDRSACRRTLRAAVLAVGLACAAVAAPAPAADARRAAPAGTVPIVVEHVTLIDGTGAPPQADMTVVIADGRFAAVVPAALDPDGGRALAGRPGAESARHLDGRGRFLIPGLMDMHVHLQGGVTVTPEGLRKAGFDRRAGEAALASYLYAGVTSLYDSGNEPDFIFGLRDDERAGRIASPRIFAAGGIVTYPGSHGSGPGSTDIDRWPEAQAALDRHLARHPDVVKFTLEERGWGARPMIPLLPEDLLRHAIVHVSSELRAMEALYAGADNLSHPVIQGPASEKYFRTLAARKNPVVSTLTIGENYSRLVEHPEYLDEPLYRASIAPAEIERLKTAQRQAWSTALWTQWMKLMTPVAMENLRQLDAAGGVVVLGTDQTLGPAVHRELELLQQAGIPPLRILRIATLNGAVFLGRESELGSVTPGKRADAVLLSADPVADVRNARAVEAVIKDGVVVDRSALPLAGVR